MSSGDGVAGLRLLLELRLPASAEKLADFSPYALTGFVADVENVFSYWFAGEDGGGWEEAFPAGDETDIAGDNGEHEGR